MRKYVFILLSAFLLADNMLPFGKKLSKLTFDEKKQIMILHSSKYENNVSNTINDKQFRAIFIKKQNGDCNIIAWEDVIAKSQDNYLICKSGILSDKKEMEKWKSFDEYIENPNKF